MIAAIVLAAGESRRMGSPKARLPFPESDGSETTFLTHLLRVIGESRARPIVVVLGHEADALLSDFDLSGVVVVVNRDYRDGMLSSIQAGVRTVRNEAVDGALVFPVDQPSVDPAVVDALIDRYEREPAPVVLPTFAGRRGHPVLFANSVFDALETAPPEVGARRVVWDHQDALVEVEVGHEGVVIDIDTPSDYERFRGRSRDDAPDSR